MFFFVTLQAGNRSYLCSMITEIKDWIDNPQRDYAAGVRLLERHSTNRNLVRCYANRSPRFAMGELVAELRRIQPTAKDAPGTAAVAAQAPTVPAVVKDAKRITHEAWVKLSKIHADLYAIGEANGEKEMAARKLLMEERDPLIERYNSCYEAKEAFFAGTLTEAQLQEVVDGKSIDAVLHPRKGKEETPLRALSDLQLAKKAKAAKAAITRCKNQLLYQQDTAAKKENPMPECPKRRDVEKRLAEKKAELAVIEEEITKRGL